MSEWEEKLPPIMREKLARDHSRRKSKDKGLRSINFSIIGILQR